jgi:hypothetical protein
MTTYYFNQYGWYTPGATSGWGSTEVAPPDESTWPEGQRPNWGVILNEWYMATYVPPPPPPDPVTIEQIMNRFKLLDGWKIRALSALALNQYDYDSQIHLQALEDECQQLRYRLASMGYTAPSRPAPLTF